MKCPSCGKDNPAGEKFCLDCGADLSAQPVPVVAASGATSGAGSLAWSDDEFKRLLNTPPPPQNCAHCGASVPAGGTFCDNCGEPLQAPAQAAQVASATAAAAATSAAPDAAQAAAAAGGTATAGPIISLAIAGPTSTTNYTMGAGEAAIGRRDAAEGIYPQLDFDGNDLVLDGGQQVHAVSRRHGRIFRDGDALKFEDLGSTNGSTLNGAPVPANAPQSLKDGDAIVLGRTCRITVHVQ